MTDDQIWLRQQHDRLGDEVQRCRLSFAELQEHRKTIATVWNDACASEMNGRFLNPMAEESSASLESLRLQHIALVNCGSALVEAYQSFLQASKAWVDVQGNIDESAAVFRTIESFLDQAISEMRSADGHANRAEQLITDAGKAGNSAQSELSYRG